MFSQYNNRYLRNELRGIGGCYSTTTHNFQVADRRLAERDFSLKEAFRRMHFFRLFSSLMCVLGGLVPKIEFTRLPFVH